MKGLMNPHPRFPRINITFKFMGYLILVSVIPLLLVGGISYQSSRKIIQEEISNYTSELINGQRNYLDLLLQGGESLIANISSVEEITNVLQDPSADTYTNLATQARIGYILNNYSNVKGLVSIDIFTLNGVHYHVGDTLNVTNVREDIRDKLFALAQGSKSDVVWDGIEDNINLDSENRQVITAAKLFTELDETSMESKPVALLVVNYQVDYLYNLFAGLDLGKGGYLMIVDQQNRVVFHPNKTLMGKHVDPQLLKQLAGDHGSKVININGQATSVIYTHSVTSGWLIASFIPIETLTASTGVIGRISLVTLVVCLTLAGILGTMYTRTLVNPIREVTNAFRLYENSGQQAIARLVERSQDEIGELVRWFNAFLDGQEARSAAEKSLREREHYLSLLNEITLAALKTTDFQGMLDTLADQIRELIQADGAYITLWNETLQKTIPAAAYGLSHDFIQSIDIPPGEVSMTESVLKAGKPLVAEDISNSPYFNPRIAALFPDRSLIGLPLIADGRRLGAVLISYHQTHQFSADEIALCEQAAGLISLSLARATLLEETRRFNEELEIRISERTLQLEEANRALEAERSSLSNRVAERTSELSAANVELARAVHAKDEFLANMSHELRTPLNAILGLSEALQEGTYGQITRNQIETLDTIYSSGQHLLLLINDILDLSKIEAGKLEIQYAWVDVEKVCQASLQLIKQQANKKDIRFSLVMDAAPEMFQADERRVKQILVNLLMNAVKFSPAGGHIVLTVRAVATPATDAKPASGANPAAICFEVQDSGIGISAKDQKRLFKPFVQIDGSLSRQHEGSGLGLALVLRLAELHGGNVSLESEVGKGSRFTVSFPVTQDNATVGKPLAADPQVQTSRSVQSEEQAGQAADSPSPLVLLAEDNEANIHMTRDFLESRGYRVIVAQNGIEAEEIALQELPALILMDMQMPGRDGLETTRRIRTYPQLDQIPVIALTALAMPGDRELCLQAGASHYLTKPVRLVDLLEVVKSYIG
jgi:signal transduction histidine kinase/CheY-like chemotaxis protein